MSIGLEKGAKVNYTVRANIDKVFVGLVNPTYIVLCGDVPVLTPVRRGQWASRASDNERGGVEKSGVAFAKANASRLFERSRLLHQIITVGMYRF